MKKLLFRILLLITATIMVFSFTSCNIVPENNTVNDAYELWKSEGNAGTVEDFLEWIKEKSTDITPSNDVDEAYELWKSEGNAGTEEDFLEWIKEKSEVFSSILDSALFEPKIVTYNGFEHEVIVTGAPSGTKITYANNVAVKVGEYHAFAYLENNGETKVLTTLLTIERAEITEYNFKSIIVTYDGGVHKIEAYGLPDGVSVNYFRNGSLFEGAIDAGEYLITAEMFGESYKPRTVTAKLTIERADTSIRFVPKTVEYNINQTHTIVVSGVIPNGVFVTYEDIDGKLFESVKTPGEYKVIAVISGGKNYKDTELEAILTVTKADLSKKIFFNDSTFKYDGTKKMIYITGEIPNDIEVKYTIWGAPYDGRIEAGSDYVVATIYGDYYKEFKLEAKIYVVNKQLNAPANLTITDEKITWDQDFKAKSYEIAVYDATNKFLFSANSATSISFVKINECRIASLLKIEGMYPGDYIVKVKAFPNGENVDEFAESEYSEPLIYTLVDGKLYPPENVRIEDNLLKWDIVPDAYYYDIVVSFVDDNGNVIKERTVVGTTGNKNTSISIDAIIAKVNFGSGNYRFAVIATPVSYSSIGIPGKEISRMSNYSDFTNMITITQANL